VASHCGQDAELEAGEEAEAEDVEPGDWLTGRQEAAQGVTGVARQGEPGRLGAR